MTHVHCKLLSLLHFILLTLHFTPPLPIHPFLSPLTSTTPFGTGDPPRGPVLHPSLTLHYVSLLVFSQPLLETLLWVTTRDICPKSRQNKLRRTPQGKVQTQWKTVRRSQESAVEDDCVQKSTFHNISVKLGLTPLYSMLQSLKTILHFKLLNLQAHTRCNSKCLSDKSLLLSLNNPSHYSNCVLNRQYTLFTTYLLCQKMFWKKSAAASMTFTGNLSSLGGTFKAFIEGSSWKEQDYGTRLWGLFHASHTFIVWGLNTHC